MNRNDLVHQCRAFGNIRNFMVYHFLKREPFPALNTPKDIQENVGFSIGRTGVKRALNTLYQAGLVMRMQNGSEYRYKPLESQVYNLYTPGGNVK